MIRMVLVAAAAVLSHGAAAQICVLSTTNLAFGTYSPLASTASSITGTVSVSCQATAAAPVAYAIQIGAGTGGAIGTRRLTAGAGQLSYQLYTDAAHTIVWGDGLAGSGTVSDSYMLAALGSAQRAYTVYGAIAARQVVPPGVYTDVVIVMITY